MRTMTEIANELGIPKKELRDSMDIEPLKSQLFTHWIYCRGKSIFFDETGETLIKASFNKNINTDDVENLHNSVVKTLLDYIQDLQEKLMEKEKLIYTLTEKKEFTLDFDYDEAYTVRPSRNTSSDNSKGDD